MGGGSESDCLPDQLHEQVIPLLPEAMANLLFRRSQDTQRMGTKQLGASNSISSEGQRGGNYDR